MGNFASKADLTSYATKDYVTTETSPYATKDYVTTETSSYATKDFVTSDLTPYATKDYVKSELSPASHYPDLTNYATKSYVTTETSPYATKNFVTSELTPYARASDVYSKASLYTRSEDDAKFSNYYTKTETDGRYATTSNVYTKSEGDAKFSNYYTKAESDGKYATTSNVYTKSEEDIRFAKYYTKAEADSKYAVASNVYSKADVDLKLASSTNTNSMKVGTWTISENANGELTIVKDGAVDAPDNAFYKFSKDGNIWASRSSSRGWLSDMISNKADASRLNMGNWKLSPDPNTKHLLLTRDGATDAPDQGFFRFTEDGNVWASRSTSRGYLSDMIGSKADGSRVNMGNWKLSPDPNTKHLLLTMDGATDTANQGFFRF